MSLFCKIKLILSIVIIISGLIFILSVVQRENALLNIYYSRHKVCRLHKIDGAFYLTNGTTYIFSDGYFWILGDQLNIEDKTPKPISSVWPELSGKLLHAFNYNNNAYMIVNNSDQLETSRRKEVFVIKYNPLRVERVAQNLEESNIPHVKCFDAISGQETCFYVPKLKTYSNNTNTLTTIKKNCRYKNSCSVLALVGPNRLDAPSLELKQNSLVLGDIYLPIQFDAYIGYRNDIIAIFFNHYYCMKRLSYPYSCRWTSYSSRFCQTPKDFDVMLQVIRLSSGTSAVIIILLLYRALVLQ